MTQHMARKLSLQDEVNIDVSVPFIPLSAFVSLCLDGGGAS